jgi:hypothetical protein
VEEGFNGRKNRGRWRKKRVTGMLLPPVKEKEWAPEEKELSDAWSFCSRRWQGWGNSGELQQQEVARMAVERWAAEHRNRGAPK